MKKVFYFSFLLILAGFIFPFTSSGESAESLSDYRFAHVRTREIERALEMYDVSNKMQDSRHRIGVDQMKLINWIRSNVSSTTNLPLSFDIPDEYKSEVYRKMGGSESVDGIIERSIVEEGLDIYDGAVGQIVLTMHGGPENLKWASIPLEIYWKGQMVELVNIRAGFPFNSFVYDPENPTAVSSYTSNKGKRGFLFRIINANGKYSVKDPLDGKTFQKDFPTWPTLHWEDWKPVAGENAWVAMAAMHLYHKKYYNHDTGEYTLKTNAVELRLAEELARAALFLQAEPGAIRMAPLGTYRNPDDFVDDDMEQGEWWFNQISSENNISWYAAFRMLYSVTGKEIYKKAMDKIEFYFKLVWNEEGKYFYQGMQNIDDAWKPCNDHFALDVQTWSILAFGPKKIDSWFGEGTAHDIWITAKGRSGSENESGELRGVGYTDEDDRVSVEWTAGAIMAAQVVAEYYKGTHPLWAYKASYDAQQMREGIESLRHDFTDSRSAYAYSSKRGWIPFGWFSHDPQVLSLASTGWVALVDKKFNPFYLPPQSSFMNSVELSRFP